MESCTQMLTVVDMTAPVISMIECPADTTVAAGRRTARLRWGYTLLGIACHPR